MLPTSNKARPAQPECERSTPMITYVVRFDDKYAVDSLRQHRALAKSRWLHWPLKIICALGMLVLAALGVAVQSYFVVGTALLFLALLTAGPYLDYFVVKRRYRRQPLYGAETTIELSEEGIQFTSQHYKSDVHWPSLSSATGFSDGVLLYLAPWHYFWLADSACRSGNPSHSREIARSKVAKYHGV
jgi:hypothetical protein